MNFWCYDILCVDYWYASLSNSCPRWKIYHDLMYCNWCRSPFTSDPTHHIVNNIIQHYHFLLHALGSSCYRSIWASLPKPISVQLYHTLIKLLHALNKSSHSFFSSIKVSLLEVQLKCFIEPSTHPYIVVSSLHNIYSHAKQRCRASRPTWQCIGWLGVNFS